MVIKATAITQGRRMYKGGKQLKHGRIYIKRIMEQVGDGKDQRFSDD
jgi:hypothetical protein